MYALLALIDGLYMARFESQCLSNENNVVNFVSRHDIYFSRMSSPIELNA